jgi:hypothetical protein
MKRMLVAGAWTLGSFGFLLLLATSCRQIVGIGDRSVAPDAAELSDAGSGPSCPLALGLMADDCTNCIQTQCCSAAQACEGVPICTSLEQCFSACAGDPGCIATCQHTYPNKGTPEVSSLESCIGTKCGTECAMVCGTRPGFGAPDSGEACATCEGNASCSQLRACAENLDCLALGACNSACPTLDCAFQCQADYEGGLATANALASQNVTCAAECLIARKWWCVGKDVYPKATAAENTLMLQAITPLNGDPVPGVTVQLCSKVDTSCMTVAATGTTDDAGFVKLPYNFNENFGGFDAYAILSAPGIATTRFYWNFPLSVQNATVGAVETLTVADEQTLLSARSIPTIPGHGHFGVAAFDCTHILATDVSFSVSPSDEYTKIYYARDTGLSDAGETNLIGLAFVLNVPAGDVSLNATSVTTGQLVSQETFHITDGGLAQVYANPLPAPQ